MVVGRVGAGPLRSASEVHRLVSPAPARTPVGRGTDPFAPCTPPVLRAVRPWAPTRRWRAFRWDAAWPSTPPRAASGPSAPTVEGGTWPPSWTGGRRWKKRNDSSDQPPSEPIPGTWPWAACPGAPSWCASAMPSSRSWPRGGTAGAWSSGGDDSGVERWWASGAARLEGWCLPWRHGSAGSSPLATRRPAPGLDVRSFGAVAALRWERPMRRTRSSFRVRLPTVGASVCLEGVPSRWS